MSRLSHLNQPILQQLSKLRARKRKRHPTLSLKTSETDQLNHTIPKKQYRKFQYRSSSKTPKPRNRKKIGTCLPTYAKCLFPSFSNTRPLPTISDAIVIMISWCSHASWRKFDPMSMKAKHMSGQHSSSRCARDAFSVNRAPNSSEFSSRNTWS